MPQRRVTTPDKIARQHPERGGVQRMAAEEAGGDRRSGQADEPPALRLVDITKTFPGLRANDNVTLEVARGEILGLLGENGAGKTTLMNIVYGLYQPDSGSIQVHGKDVTIKSPQQAVSHGIGMVHQHFMLVPDMTVAENVALSPSRAPGLSRLADVERSIEELSERFGLAIDPHAVVGDLPLGARQRVEIIKLLHRGADLLILDEPTAALTPEEWRELSLFLRSIADQGASVIFITHKLDELFGLVDRCVVLRDAAVVGSVAIADTDKQSLARMMVGREVVLRVERPIVEPGRPVLEVSNLSVQADGRTVVDDLSFEVRAGEVFGVAGVGGNGQNELVDAVIGLQTPSSGLLRFDGQVPERLNPREFTKLGGALIPEDRHEEGLALDLTLLENLILKDFDRPPYSRRGILDPRRAGDHCERLLSEYDVRGAGPTAPARLLSGGNQQKLVLARELSRGPRLIVACQPTRGLDVGAMEFVYRKLNEAKRSGCAILLISFELEEIFSLSDRFAVMADGHFMATLTAEEADVERVGLLMGGADHA
jgi:general nucleoside transport system ATP-binding protein